MPTRTIRAVLYGLLLWIIGFIWGSVVFMTPALKNIASIPYVSRYPAISFPLLVVLPAVAYLLARKYLRATGRSDEGLKLGLTFALVNLLLDVLVLVLLFRNGLPYFASLTVWLSYFLLLIVPWRAGASDATQSQNRER